MHSCYLYYAHAYRIAEGLTLLEYELIEEEPQQEQETQEPEEVPASELPECPEHLPTNCIK